VVWPTHLRRQAALPEIADELCAVAQDIRSEAGDIRPGMRATEREIKRLSANGELAKYRMLHFATHGGSCGALHGTREPGLILTPPDNATEEDDGYSEIATLKLDADWVVLSACNTAAGAATSAEALSGLARAFIYARPGPCWFRTGRSTRTPPLRSSPPPFAKWLANPRSAEQRLCDVRCLRSSPKATRRIRAYWAPFVVAGEAGRER
jgi:CHAT domain